MEIRIDVLNLSGQAGRLTALAGSCLQSQEAVPAMSGEGYYTQTLDALLKEYDSMGTILSELVSNTASFFSNVRNSFTDTDMAVSGQF